MKARAVNAAIENWDVWVGRGPEPGTGRKLDGARWGNPYEVSEHGKSKSMRLYFEKLAKDPARVDRARLELVGKRLGRHGNGPGSAEVLASLANGSGLHEIADEWRKSLLLAEEKPLFAEEAR